MSSYSGAYPTANIVIGPVDFKERGLMQYVQSIRINKNADKTQTIGRKRIKSNNCDIVISNPNGIFDNILRWGRKVTVWLGHKDQYLTRVGVYRLMAPSWTYPQNGVPTIHYKGEGGETKLMVKRTAVSKRNADPIDVIDKLVKAAGLEFEGPPEWKGERFDIALGSEEHDWDAIQRIAADLALDVWVDDSKDPNVVHVRELTSNLGDDDEELTIGWGPKSTGAESSAFPALSIQVEHRYPQPTPSGGATTKGKQTVQASARGTDPRKPSVLREFTTTADAANVEAVATRAAGNQFTKFASNLTSVLKKSSTANRLVKSASAKFAPLIPFFRLGQVVLFENIGDQSGKYRVIDITHEWSVAGGFTTIKAVKGGTAKQPAPKKDAGPRAEASARGTVPNAATVTREILN